MNNMQQHPPGDKPRRARKKPAGAGPAAPREFKAVVRRLPPHLPRAVFERTAAAWTPDDRVVWRSFVAGKLSKRAPAKPNTFARAYLAFASLEHLLEFAQAFNGWLFKDEKTGTEYRAQVEMAPFQKTPRRKPRVDYRVNTLDTDPEYLAFLESLTVDPKEAFAAAQSAEASTTATSVIAEDPKSTPLLDDLRAKKAALLEASEKRNALRKAKKAANDAALLAAKAARKSAGGPKVRGAGKSGGFDQ
ncbi:Smg-4/UPF3 family-domain-containing protein [Obelidium mucronatum]|nr:Smg-4/UPF3 family-domain-containing protein [Obelidium mucronatum]